MALNPPSHYLAPFAALRDYVFNLADPRLAAFMPALDTWGETWQPVEAVQLPVSSQLESALDNCDPGARNLLQTCIRHGHRLHWEQSYRRADSLVPERMLDGYGFAEFVGLRGPLLSDRIRAGIAIWGPQIDYPQHRHEARSRDEAAPSNGF